MNHNVIVGNGDTEQVVRSEQSDRAGARHAEDL